MIRFGRNLRTKLNREQLQVLLLLKFMDLTSHYKGCSVLTDVVFYYYARSGTLHWDITRLKFVNLAFFEAS
jgi:hypothetical protein